MYRYRYFGVWPNLELYSGSGAYHGSDLRMILRGVEDVTAVPNTPLETRTMRYMKRPWVSFVWDPSRGLQSEMRWPLCNPQRDTLVRLGFDDSPGASYSVPAVYDSGCLSNESTPGA